MSPDKVRSQLPKLPRSAPRLAVIGCGAFTEVFYLPALAAFPDVTRDLILIDPNGERLQKLANRFHIRECRADHHDILDRVDGVIIATPHWLHYPIAMEFLARRVHVLCEKPLAEMPEQARAMALQAEESGVTIGVNLTQRLFPSNIKIKEMLATGALGKPHFMSYAWGAQFTWPTASGFYFDGTASRRGGVLLDRGPHALDLICWWLGRKPEVILSENDSFGGIEAATHVELNLEDCHIDVRLSWLSELSNSCSIHSDRMEIENNIHDWWVLPVKDSTGKAKRLYFDCPEQTYNDFGRKVVANFIDVIGRGASPLVPASEAIPSIELIDECYAKATQFKMPWYDNLEIV